MTPPRGFDHIMLHHEAGHSLKLRRLTAAEKCAWVFGVLPIAGKARMRGAFTVGDSPATADDVAAQSGETKKTAAGLLAKMRDLGMLERDDELDIEWVHNFEDHNPEPKIDKTGPDRARRYRERQKAKRHGTVTAPSRRDGAVRHASVTPPEGEGEEKQPPEPPKGGPPQIPSKPQTGRARDTKVYDRQVAEYAAAVFPDVPGRDAAYLINAAVGEGKTTAADLEGYVRRYHPNGLSDEQRDGLHVVGARMREINAGAAT